MSTKPSYDCLKCPAYCCSYENISVGKRDLKRLARHFEIDVETAHRRFTKVVDGDVVMRHQQDGQFRTVCMFLDGQTRRCTIYEARPAICHDYPTQPRCGYYEFLKWEQSYQEDPDFIPMQRY